MAVPQFVGRTSAYTASSMGTGGQTISLTSLVDGLDSSPSVGDVIFVYFAVGGTIDQTLSIKDASGGADYQLVESELYSNDTNDANLRVAYKVVTGTPDTSFFVAPSSASAAVVVVAEVFRRVDLVNPLDVAATTDSGLNTGRPNPPSITPVSPGALVVSVSAGGAYYNEGSALTSSDLDDFYSVVGNGVTFAWDVVLGVGYKAWTSGAVDPAQLGGNNTNTQSAWASITFALRPYVATIPTGRADVTNTAYPLTGKSIRVLGLASEVDSAHALSVVQITPTGLTTSGNAAYTLGVARGLHLTTSGNTAYSLSGVSIRAAGLTISENLAFSLSTIANVGLAVETGIAFALGVARPVGRADSTNNALALTRLQIRGVGIAVSAQFVGWRPAVQIRPVQLLEESDTAFALAGFTFSPVGPATEQGFAFSLYELPTPGIRITFLRAGSRNITVKVGSRDASLKAGSRTVYLKK